MGRCGVRISPQLGHVRDAGGGPQCPRRWEETLSNWVGRGGELQGEEKWRLERTSAPEGWLGEGRGSLAWRNPRGLGGSEGSAPSVCPAQLGPQKPAGLPDQVLCSLRPPLGRVAPRGIGGRWGEEKRAGRGPPDQRIKGSMEGISPTHLAPRTPLGFRVWSLPSGALSSRVGPRGTGGGEEERPMRRDPLGLEDQGNAPSISPHTLGPREPAGVLDLVLCPPRPEALASPSCCVEPTLHPPALQGLFRSCGS